MKTRRVLVFPAGTEIGLEIHEALRGCKEVLLFGAGAPVSSHAPFVYQHFHPLPSIHEADWLRDLCALCEKLEIDYIFPAYDDVLVALAQERQRIPAVVLTAPLQTCLTTRSKRATYQALSQFVRVPRVLDGTPQPQDYPVFVKPDQGQGSQQATRADDPEQLAAAKAAARDALVCELLPGEEYTVDCLSDREHGLLFAGARARLRMRNGIAVSTRTIAVEGIAEMARRIHGALDMRGAWFFQVKRAADGALTLLEVAPRIAGSMGSHRVQGVNFPLLTIFEHERLHLRILLNDDNLELDRALGNRFRHSIRFSALYMDLDDTLVLRGEVNTDAVSLIYKCINAGIKVKLITRHAGDLNAMLARHRLAGLFDAVIHLRAGEPKSAHISEADAILIDDSFAERWDVARKLGLRTFDCSMIELLLHAQPGTYGHRLRGSGVA